MSEKAVMSSRTQMGLDIENRKYLGNGIAWSGVLYIAMGFFMIVVGNIWLTLPLNTPSIFQIIGYYGQADYIKYMSIAFFGIAVLVIASGILYKKRGEEEKIRKLSKIVAIVQQPWIAIALIAIAGVWLYIILDADGDLAAAIASMNGLDVSDEQQKYEFIWLMEKLPIVPFLLFGVFSIAIYPMTMYSSAILLQDTGMSFPWDPIMSYDDRARKYAVKGMLVGGVYYIIIGVAIWGLGYVRAIGIDVFYPNFPMETYPMWLNVYYIFPIAFGICCIATSFLYYFYSTKIWARSLAWYCGFMQMLVPVFGWFFGINLMLNLWHSGKEMDAKVARRGLFYGFSVAIFSTLVPLFIFIMIGLNRIVPTSFRFAIDWSNLKAQVDGLVWTFTLVLVLFYFIAGFYLIMESIVSNVAAQRSFQRGLACMFLFLGLVELSVLMYSIFKVQPYPGIIILPPTIPAPADVRGDNSVVFLLACASVIYITYCIEKYIKNSKNMVITKLIFILALGGVAALIFSFIPAISGGEWYQIGGYVFMGLPIIGLAFGVLMILITYGQLAAQTSGDIKKNALTILYGFLITVVAAILHVLRSSLSFPFNWVVFIVLNIVGVIVFMQGILKSSY
nr:hypothetical protein [Candidatus Sigynarchaeota archaeon]